MNSVTISSQALDVSMPAADRDAALRYISEIAHRDPLAFLGPEYEAERSSDLWDRFVATYVAVTTGPCARHGRDAIRVALGQL